MHAGDASQATLPASFEVVVWNVHKEREALEDELPTLAQDADLVLLQEGRGARLALEGEATQVVTFRDVRGGTTNGVVTWSRAVSAARVPLRTSSREPIARTPKSALVTTYSMGCGTTLLVANVHGINFRLAPALERQLGALAEVIAMHRGPVLVAGDFNTWSPRRRAALQAFADGLGLRTVFDDSDAPRLDAVLVRGLGVDDASIVETEHSDHDALIVSLRLRTDPACRPG